MDSIDQELNNLYQNHYYVILGMMGRKNCHPDLVEEFKEWKYETVNFVTLLRNAQDRLKDKPDATLRELAIWRNHANVKKEWFQDILGRIDSNILEREGEMGEEHVVDIFDSYY